MAQALLIDDIVKVRVICFQGTQSAINVRHYRVSNIAGNGATDAQAAARFDVLLATTYRLMMTGTGSYRGDGVLWEGPGSPTVEVSNSDGTGPGNVIGEPLPPQNAGLIKFISIVAGRAGRGFLYTPFPGEADNTGNGICSAGYILNLDALGGILSQPVTVGTLPDTANLIPVLYNRVTKNTITVTGFKSRPYFSQQKRRSYLRRGDVPAF